jgi:hypothetical protein
MLGNAFIQRRMSLAERRAAEVEERLANLGCENQSPARASAVARNGRAPSRAIDAVRRANELNDRGRTFDGQR